MKITRQNKTDYTKEELKCMQANKGCNICPNCGELLCDDGYKYTDIKYCDQCGQALDWENT